MISRIRMIRPIGKYIKPLLTTLAHIACHAATQRLFNTFEMYQRLNAVKFPYADRHLQHP
jgi:hypothetical protein